MYYVSPEQVASETVDARRNLYSLGVLGVLALTGRFPFEGDLASAVLIAHVTMAAHANDEVEAVVRSAAGRLLLLYLLTHSPCLNPIEMLWRHFRREGNHGELFDSVEALPDATHDFFDHYNRTPERTLSVIGAHLVGTT